MRPSTPNFNFTQQAGPSSPPATPTTGTFNFSSKNRRHGVANFSQPLSTQDIETGGITPNGNGPTFSYNRFQVLDVELSPRTSSPASSEHSSASSTSSAHLESPRPRSRSSSPGTNSPPLKPQIRTRIISEGNFTLEEFDAEDYDAFDSDTESIIRPHQYEDAESDRARSTKGTSPNRELDPRILHGLSNLRCAQPEDDELEEREIWAQKQREERRRKRRSSSSVKRNFAASIGSDTDDEDIQPVFEGINEAGSSARRLRRKVGQERISLIFDDPPPRIEELEEPESCEEVVSVEEEDGEGQGVDKNLPYYVQDMDVDSDDDSDDD